VLYSDGLFEAPDAAGEPYGLERPRRVIAARNDGTARELLDALVADWRAAVGRAAPDDTTILVVRRLPVTPAAAAALPGR
jgi:serine phosphatase RsbU (regulator of sigma subunit)